ncbi:MAG TPA: hypothetical protein VGG83_20520 [Trebonia sp.]
MTVLQPAGSVVVVLADGEAREAARDAAGSYDCPFCGNVTVSPQGWGDQQSYPAWMRAAYEAGGCASPACPANMSAGQLAAWREQRARQDAEKELRRRASAQMAAGRQLAEEKRAAERARLTAQAADAGQCLDCLGYSLRKGHQPRLVRHRDPANCPVSRGR